MFLQIIKIIFVIISVLLIIKILNQYKEIREEEIKFRAKCIGILYGDKDNNDD